MSATAGLTSDFSQVVELPGHRATRDQVAMMHARYAFARERCHGKRVLEVACGGGTGLGYLAEVASGVVGGDLDERNLAFAQRTYAGDHRVELYRLDAHSLPFPAESFDVVILFDALYFLRSFDKALGELRRVLRPGGSLLLSTVNVHWDEFNPSPMATRYYDGRELAQALQACGMRLRAWGGFRAAAEPSQIARYVGALRRFAIRLHLIPTNLRAKEALKRLFYGRLVTIAPTVADGATPAERLTELEPVRLTEGAFKILYFEARK